MAGRVGARVKVTKSAEPTPLADAAEQGVPVAALEELTVGEVSLVDRPASLRPFIVIKSESDREAVQAEVEKTFRAGVDGLLARVNKLEVAGFTEAADKLAAIAEFMVLVANAEGPGEVNALLAKLVDAKVGNLAGTVRKDLGEALGALREHLAAAVGMLDSMLGQGGQPQGDGMMMAAPPETTVKTEVVAATAAVVTPPPVANDVIATLQKSIEKLTERVATLSRTPEPPSSDPEGVDVTPSPLPHRPRKGLGGGWVA